MSRVVSSLVILGCAVSLASSAGVSPELEPASSKKFFNEDFPVDHHPVADEHYYFDHPYPAVQDSGDFDKDFVQDENADGGKWQSQMEYDILRQKVRQAEKELARLKKIMEEEAAEMRAAEKEWQKALSKVGVAKAETLTEESKENAAKQDVDAATDRVNSAARKVEKEMKDLEDCKKALEDAKQRLKDLLAKKKALEEKAEADREAALTEEQKAQEKKVKQKKEAEQKKKEAEEKAEKQRKEQEKKKKEEEAKRQQKLDEEEKKLAEAYKSKLDKYESKMDTYEKKMAEIARQKAAAEAKHAAQKKAVADAIADMKKKDDTWQKKLNEEKAEYAAASKTYDDLMNELRETEASLEKAADKLKTFRRPPHVDDNGGVYNVPESAARPSQLSLLLLACAAAMSLW